MAVRNDLFGVYKIAKINNIIYLVKDVVAGREMETNDESFIQGTAETRILNVGMLSSTYSVEAPIVVGGGAGIDGRTLLNENILNSLLKSGATLPILDKASIDISADQGASVKLSLASDGNKNNVADFKITNGDPPIELDPTVSMPTRVARHFDFRVKFGPYQYFIQKAQLEISTKLAKKAFIGGTTDGLSYPTDPSTMTQFPFFGVTGMTLSGNGTAAVSIGEENTPVTPGGLGTNDSQLRDAGAADVTYQSAGETSVYDGDFAIEVYDARFGWQSLFTKSDGSQLIDLSKAIVTKAEFHASNEMITVNFAFKCYIKVVV